MSKHVGTKYILNMSLHFPKTHVSETPRARNYKQTMSIFATPAFPQLVVKLGIDMEHEPENLENDPVLKDLEDKMEALTGTDDKTKIQQILLERQLTRETIKHSIKSKQLLENGTPTDGWLTDEAYNTILKSLVDGKDYGEDDQKVDIFAFAGDLQCTVDHDGKRYSCRVIATNVLKYDEYEYLSYSKKISQDPVKLDKYIQLDLLECL